MEHGAICDAEDEDLLSGGDGRRGYTFFMSAAPQIHPEELSEAELFESDGRQAVRLPEGIHLAGKTVKVRLVGGGVLLEPTSLDLPQAKVLDRKRTTEEIRAMFEYIDSLEADPLFPDGRDQGVAEERLPVG
jgi:virulence-associated protein VagC